MKKYVFLTQSISGITGNQRYVNNKCRWLCQNGWDVIVFWNYNVSPVELEHVKCFDKKEYIYHELKFYPSWFNNVGRKKVLCRLASIIGQADQIVIESNKLELAAWGELLAHKLHCKHVAFVTTEGISICNKDTFDYCYAKLLRHEFFNINSAVVSNFFSNFINIDNPEEYYWSATQGVEVDEYSFPVFDQLPHADYTITHFGRNKEYIPYLLSEFSSFFASHPEKTFNCFFLGDSIQQNVVKDLLSLSNVKVAFHPNVTVIPKQVFNNSDIVFATAGCVTLASDYNPFVISMDVNTNEPLGLYKHTTLDTNTFSGKYKNDRSIFQWLESILIKRDKYPLLEDQRVVHSFDYQIKAVDQCDYQYIDSTKVEEPMTRHDRLYAFLVKIGLFRIVEYFYFKRRGVKIIIRR